MKTGEVRAHVRRRLPDVPATADPEALSGGNLNLVWRVPTGTRSVIVKYAPPYVASAPDIALDPKRILLEARCLEALGPGGVLCQVSTSAARPPELFDIDPDRSVLVMEDVGAHLELGAWLRSAKDARPAAEELGGFIGRLHAVSHGDARLARDFDNRGVQRTRHEVQYCGARQFATRAGLARADDIGRRCVALGERFQRPGFCLTMGDLWPRSVLVAAAGVRVIDWELAHFGSPAQDIGHLAAHLWMHAECAGRAAEQRRWQEFSDSFLAAYLDTLGAKRPVLMGGSVAEAAVVHFGAEVLMRTFGPFAKGYLYDAESTESPAIRKAARVAARNVLSPTDTGLYGRLLG